jgi:hypothetical protein
MPFSYDVKPWPLWLILFFMENNVQIFFIIDLSTNGKLIEIFFSNFNI